MHKGLGLNFLALGGDRVDHAKKLRDKYTWCVDPAAVNRHNVVLGSGAFARVELAEWSAKRVALKLIKLGESKLSLFEKEVDVWLTLAHPNVVAIYGICIYTDEVGILLEYCKHGSLSGFLGAHPKLAWETKLRLAIGAARGMAYLHSRNPPVLHRDVKTDNFLVDASLMCKVSDFGVSKTDQFLLSGQAPTTKIGTAPWMPPEALGRDPQFTTKSDVYSFSLVLWELVTGQKHPLLGLSDAELLTRVTCAGERPPLGWPTHLNWLEELVRHCWDRDPERRPDFPSILSTMQGRFRPDDVEGAQALLTAARQRLSEGQRSVRIVLTGLAGVGKSSTINSIFGRNILVEGNTVYSQTAKIKPVVTRYGAFTVEFVDTPGFGGASHDPEQATRDWQLVSEYLICNPPDCILLVFDPFSVLKIGGSDEEEHLQQLKFVAPKAKIVLVATHRNTVDSQKVQGCASAYQKLLAGIYSPTFKTPLVEVENDRTDKGVLRHPVTNEALLLARPSWLAGLLEELVAALEPRAALVLSVFLNPVDLGAVVVEEGGAGRGSVLLDAELARSKDVLSIFWARKARKLAQLTYGSQISDDSDGLSKKHLRVVNLVEAVVRVGQPKIAVLLAYLRRGIRYPLLFREEQSLRTRRHELGQLFYSATSVDDLRKALETLEQTEVTKATGPAQADALRERFYADLSELALHLLRRLTSALRRVRYDATPKQEPSPEWRAHLFLQSAASSLHSKREPEALQALRGWADSLPQDLYGNFLRPLFALFSDFIAAAPTDAARHTASTLGNRLAAIIFSRKKTFPTGSADAAALQFCLQNHEKVFC